jgi:hypothetical protein
VVQHSPPPDPMSQDEALAFVNNMLNAWLAAKLGRPVP